MKATTARMELQRVAAWLLWSLAKSSLIGQRHQKQQNGAADNAGCSRVWLGISARPALIRPSGENLTLGTGRGRLPWGWNPPFTVAIETDELRQLLPFACLWWNDR